MMMDNLFFIGVLFFIFYFILIRPQQKRLRAHQEMMKALAKGDKVMTAGGIIGTIIKFEGDDIAVVEIAQNVRVRVSRATITEVLTNTPGLGETANDN
jgi:preprotein translocase subunit YajC